MAAFDNVPGNLEILMNHANQSMTPQLIGRALLLALILTGCKISSTPEVASPLAIASQVADEVNVDILCTISETSNSTTFPPDLTAKIVNRGSDEVSLPIVQNMLWGYIILRSKNKTTTLFPKNIKARLGVLTAERGHLLLPGETLTLSLRPSQDFVLLCEQQRPRGAMDTKNVLLQVEFLMPQRPKLTVVKSNVLQIRPKT